MIPKQEQSWEKWVRTLAESTNSHDRELLAAKIKVLIDAERARAVEEERERILQIIEGMKEEDNYSTAYTDYTPEKAIENSKAILNYNHALSDLTSAINPDNKHE